ncbi:hypothetical protein AA309_23750 [Microvirga vignae]|uniref:Uncharacterized protein n=1 Tax=Microvirga vignae TaxID=1225564 RepID=A0A0H1R6R2_9HYPH|nr:hypothetical protein AA309_23750 [Microvirga vignae]
MNLPFASPAASVSARTARQRLRVCLGQECLGLLPKAGDQLSSGAYQATAFGSGHTGFAPKAKADDIVFAIRVHHLISCFT